MALRTRGFRVSLIGALGTAGLLGVIRAKAKKPRRRTVAELERMTDAEFVAFVNTLGMKPATTAGVVPD